MIITEIRRLIAVISICGIMLLTSMTAKCDDSISKPLLPVASSFTLSYGGASILDTYLTPIRYNGWDLRLGYERLQAMKFNPQKWVMQFNYGLSFSDVKNIVKNREMYSLMLQVEWGMMHRWNNVLTPGLKLYLGGTTSLNGGVIYNQYNSNNPVSVKINLSANMSAMAVYGMKIGRLPITLRYQATLPVLGAFFSPEYGEALYELYLGNLKNIVHCGWWGNRFDMTNLITADLHFGTTALRIGYRGTIESSWVNNLNTQIFTNNFLLGVSGEWLSLNQTKKLSEKANIISAIY